MNKEVYLNAFLACFHDRSTLSLLHCAGPLPVSGSISVRIIFSVAKYTVYMYSVLCNRNDTFMTWVHVGKFTELGL